MAYEVVPLPFKPPRLEGLSERLLASHYENNYGGAVRRLNAIEKRLAQVDWAVAPVFEINGLSRERLIAANSMILHEIYFDGLGGRGSPAGDLAEALARDFGSVDRWRAEFTAMGKAEAGGSGWVLLTWSARLGRLTNQWAADHAHILAEGVPIIALDMYEHAYHLDFGAKAAAYVDAVMTNIHWERVAARYRCASKRPAATAEAATVDRAEVTVTQLQAMLDRGEDVVVLDVCLAEDLAKRSDMLPSARPRAPETIAQWADELPRGKPIIAYCVYGFQVSGDAVAELRRRGFDARSLAGGISAWHAMGGATIPLPETRTPGDSA
jgi:superoxide dismutase, Fe-Mn family